MTTIIVMYGISVLSILLGFIALLAQRIYLDSETSQPTQLIVPFLGKVKTNYPALIFVILGFSMAYIAFDKSYERPKVAWTIEGSLKMPANGHLDWAEGTLSIHPADFQLEVSPTGKFRVNANLPEGQTFEDVVEFIDYSNKKGSAKIYPIKELEHYRQNTSSLIEHMSETSRVYKPVTMEIFSE